MGVGLWHRQQGHTGRGSVVVVDDNQERLGCGPFPPMDKALAAVVALSKSLLGKSTCSSKNSKVIDRLLGKMHGAMVVQAQLAKTQVQYCHYGLASWRQGAVWNL